MLKPASPGSLLTKKGSCADSRLLVGAHGRPNYDLCVQSSRALASTNANSGLLLSLPWADTGLASAHVPSSTQEKGPLCSG